MKSVGERIKFAIRHSGITQSDLARITGATRSAVSQWVNGETITVKAEYIFSIADATGFEARWLATGRGPERSLNAGFNDLAKIYATLDERGKATVMRAAETERAYIVSYDNDGDDDGP